MLFSNNSLLTLNDRECTPLALSPSHLKKPFLHFLDQKCQMLWIGFHDLVKFGEFSRPEKDFRQAKLEIVLIQTKGFEERLKKQRRQKTNH